MKKLSNKDIIMEQAKLNELNASGRYSFIQTIDENGDIHVDCDIQTYVQEMGYVSLEQHLKRLNSLEDEYSNKNS